MKEDTIMDHTLNFKLISALEDFTHHEFERLLLGVEKEFEEQLSIIPDAPDAGALLLEAIEDLLHGNRKCPLEKVNLKTCLFKIVRSKVSHHYWRCKRKGILKAPAGNLEDLGDENQSDLFDRIIERVADDPILERIVRYRLAHAEDEPIKAKQVAEALEIDIHEIYKANRRLRHRLKSLI